MLYVAEYTSSLGRLALFGSDRGLRGVSFLNSSHEQGTLVTKKSVLNPQAFPNEELVPNEGAFETIKSELDSYFLGEIREFAVELDFGDRGTPFQRQVWNALREIPYGTCLTYGELAQQIGNPKAARAVGLANNRNPLAIVVPCHRVIGANGSLVGYAGGLDFKRALLELEGVSLRADASSTTRASLLQAGAHEFAHHGFEGASIDAIAARASVNRRMIYHHFSSKRGLYDAVDANLESLNVAADVTFRFKLMTLLQHGAVNSNQLETQLTQFQHQIAQMQRDGSIDVNQDANVLARLLYLIEQFGDLVARRGSRPLTQDDLFKLVQSKPKATRTIVSPTLKRI